jgi:hypothetical protein
LTCGPFPSAPSKPLRFAGRRDVTSEYAYFAADLIAPLNNAEHQRFHRRPPLWHRMLSFRKFGDVGTVADHAETPSERVGLPTVSFYSRLTLAPVNWMTSAAEVAPELIPDVVQPLQPLGDDVTKIL